GSMGGSLTFGDGLESARVLGRPDECEGKDGNFTLRYDSYGMEVEFEPGRFVKVTFSMAEGEDGGRFSSARRGPDGLSLTSRTTKQEVLDRFGEPTTRDEYEDEDFFYYIDGPLASELEFDEHGRLVRWAVYLD
ncbi:MAG: hypothetical protein ACT4QD_23290, partial [Acidobacteriota bacterium]